MKKYFRIALYLAIIGLIAIVSVNYYVRSSTKNKIYYTVKKFPKNDVGIIFGAGINGDQPSKYLKDRLDAGILLYKMKRINKILLSGDNGRDEYDELTVMKNYCYNHGVDTTKIFVDYAGFDTYSTMYRAKHIFKIKKATLISQEYHLNRAIYIGQKLGIKSAGYSANNGEYHGYKYVCFREYGSIFKSFFDVLRDREPRFLGNPININGLSNYSKEDKR
ncbi:SanA protein [Flavobacterium sp. CF108]|uniref:SanA/YdcF family protein n=1 Tax=unclassified Flavobacterium TaxID=196869 RepID=UPI0008B470BD|nr:MULTISPECIES: ElyC/SanA/YdcF family protein [unclassified Flavobacterium]SEO53314.1 SanA protein [Flavobacterium sp. fv08]SHH74774.1 SanA protein [Flavobacterium sp. CF108]